MVADGPGIAASSVAVTVSCSPLICGAVGINTKFTVAIRFASPTTLPGIFDGNVAARSASPLTVFRRWEINNLPGARRGSIYWDYCY